MATISQGFSQTGIRFAGRNGLVDKYYYFVLSLLTTTIVFWGFSHTVDAVLVHPAVPVPSILWVHVAAFSAWMCFLVLQSTLVRTRNVNLHRTLGWFGVALGAFMVPLGITTAIIVGHHTKHVLHLPGRERILILAFSDMVVFPILLALAVFWRKKRDLHRALLMATGCLFLNAALARVPFVQQLPFSLYFCVAFLDLVFLTGALRDWLVNRRVQPIYYILTPILAAFQLFECGMFYWTPSWWMNFASRLLD